MRQSKKILEGTYSSSNTTISIYNIFSKVILSEIKKNYAHISSGDMLKRVGNIWKSLNDEEKKIFKSRVLGN